MYRNNFGGGGRMPNTNPYGNQGFQNNQQQQQQQQQPQQNYGYANPQYQQPQAGFQQAGYQQPAQQGFNNPQQMFQQQIMQNPQMMQMFQQFMQQQMMQQQMQNPQMFQPGFQQGFQQNHMVNRNQPIGNRAFGINSGFGNFNQPQQRQQTFAPSRKFGVDNEPIRQPITQTQEQPARQQEIDTSTYAPLPGHEFPPYYDPDKYILVKRYIHETKQYYWEITKK